MRDESGVWQALLRRKGLSVTDLAGELGVTRQHAHRLLTGRRPAESQRDELEHALALGTPGEGQPLFAIGELDDHGARPRSSRRYAASVRRSGTGDGCRP